MQFRGSSEAQDSLGEHTLYGKIQVYTIEPLPDNVSLSSVTKSIEKSVPEIFFHNVDSVYIGHFKEFEENDTNAFYSDGGLFISNNQTDEADLIDDIIHETAHAVEEEYRGFIYDDQLEKEFIGKRKRLFDRLTSGRSTPSYKFDFDLTKEDFLRLEYDEDFDKLLYQDLGYSFLNNLTYDLFVSPYGATSLQEYWANGFENYFIGDPMDVKKISPVLYNKISTLAEEL